MAAFGVSPDQAQSLASSDPDFCVWPDNWQAVLVFVACETQWRWTDLGRGHDERVGLEDGAVRNEIRDLARPRKEQRQLLEQVRVMERAALEAMRLS